MKNVFKTTALAMIILLGSVEVYAEDSKPTVSDAQEFISEMAASGGLGWSVTRYTWGDCYSKWLQPRDDDFEELYIEVDWSKAYDVVEERKNGGRLSFNSVTIKLPNNNLSLIVRSPHDVRRLYNAVSLLQKSCYKKSKFD